MPLTVITDFAIVGKEIPAQYQGMEKRLSPSPIGTAHKCPTQKGKHKFARVFYSKKPELLILSANLQSTIESAEDLINTMSGESEFYVYK